MYKKLQELFGATKSEITAVLVILGGLVIGVLSGTFRPAEEQQDHSDIYQILDSLAEARRTSYIGADLQGNVDTALAKGDTVYEPDSYFPKSKKKELPDAKINLNTASKVQLMKLPGVGEITAAKIIRYRESSPLTAIVQIQNVKGIGPKKFEKMKAFITVE